MGAVDKSVILHCIRCREVMIYNKRDDFWQCPLCGGEWWDDQSKLKIVERDKKDRETQEELRQKIRWSISMQRTQCFHREPIPAGVPAPGGGGSKSGKRKKKPKKIQNEPWVV